MTITSKTYTGCPRKQAARDATIINLYRQLRGPSIPLDKQYWSMCAHCANKDGIIEGSELDQIIKAGLIKQEQFHGVDNFRDKNTGELTIYNSNSQYSGCHWYGEDFLIAMQEEQSAGKFNPEIVNADLINMHEGAASRAGKILNFLYDSGNVDTIFILNVVLKAHNRHSDVVDLAKSLCKDSVFRIIWNKGLWKILENEAYTYHGTQPNKSVNNDAKNPKTIMGTVVFVPNK